MKLKKKLIFSPFVLLLSRPVFVLENRRHDSQHNGIQHNGTQHYNSDTKGLFETLSIYDTQHT
jgi:hypothetical protein